MIDVFVAETAVDAVRDQDEIGVGEAGFVLDVRLEIQDDAQFARARLEDQEQLLPRAATKAVAADPMDRSAEVHGDVIPVGEFLGDAAIARKVVLLEIIECGVREHHAKAEGVVGAVALVDRDLGVRPLLLQQDCSVETRRSATDDRDFHGSLANSIRRNYFKPKIISRKSPLRWAAGKARLSRP